MRCNWTSGHGKLVIFNCRQSWHLDHNTKSTAISSWCLKYLNRQRWKTWEKSNCHEQNIPFWYFTFSEGAHRSQGKLHPNCSWKVNKVSNTEMKTASTDRSIFPSRKSSRSLQLPYVNKATKIQTSRAKEQMECAYIWALVLLFLFFLPFSLPMSLETTEPRGGKTDTRRHRTNHEDLTTQQQLKWLRRTSESWWFGLSCVYRHHKKRIYYTDILLYADIVYKFLLISVVPCHQIWSTKTTTL